MATTWSGRKDIKKRKVALDKFLLDLQIERPKPKAKKKKVIRQPVFEKGDCLTFKLANGNYSGVVVLEAIKNTEYGHNLIASTRINQSYKPTKKDFENAEVLVINYANWDNQSNICWYLPLRHKGVVHLIERVDNLEVQLNYDRNTSMLSGVADFDIWFIEVADKQFEFEKTKPQPTTKHTIKDLIKKKSKWKLW